MTILEDFEFDSFKDQDVRITPAVDGTLQKGIGKLERCLFSGESQEHTAIPIVQYTKTLKHLRKESQKISNCSDEMTFLLLKKRVESKKVTYKSVLPSLIVSGFARNPQTEESVVG